MSEPRIVDPSGRPVETRLATLDFGRLDTLDPDRPDAETLRALEQRVLFRDALTRHALKQSSVSQWCVFKGEDGRESIYPMGAAAAAMFSFFGLHWRGSSGSLFDAALITDSKGERYWEVSSDLCQGEKILMQFMGKRYLDSGYAKNEADAKLAAFENLQSRACRWIFGLSGKSREDFKLLGLDLTNARIATFKDHKAARSTDPEQATVRFGTAKGTKVADLSDKDLAYYLGAAKADAERAAVDPATLKDPKEKERAEKARKYQAGNEAMLAALMKESERRKAAAAPQADDANEMDKLLVLIREEAAALDIPEEKVEKGIKGLKSVAHAAKFLAQLRERRKAAAKESGAEG